MQLLLRSYTGISVTDDLFSMSYIPGSQFFRCVRSNGWCVLFNFSGVSYEVKKRLWVQLIPVIPVCH